MKTKILLTLLAFISLTSCAQSDKVKQVTSTEAAKLITSDKKMVVLDVRTAEEFAAGHIKGAINIDIKQPDAFSKIDKLNHDTKYLVHCRTNHRSTIAVNHMVESGFKNILQMSDGYNGWSTNGLPEEK